MSSRNKNPKKFSYQNVTVNVKDVPTASSESDKKYKYRALWVLLGTVIVLLTAASIGIPLYFNLTRNKDAATIESTTVTTTTVTTGTTSTSTSTSSSTTTTVTTSSTTTASTSTTSTTATSTTSTTTTSPSTTVCVSCSDILLLSDTNTATVQTLVNDLQSVGLTVNYISGGITTYTGTPAASSYGSVFLLTGDSYATDMPVTGQQSIVNAQQANGTGVVMTEWAAYQVQSGRWTTLSSLLLATRLSGNTGTMSYTLINSGHPIWNGLATSLSTSVTFGYSTFSTIASGSTIISNCTSCGTAAVIIRPSSGTAGRIVQIAHAGHYGSAAFNWANDANVLTMMRNAIQWAAKLI